MDLPSGAVGGKLGVRSRCVYSYPTQAGRLLWQRGILSLDRSIHRWSDFGDMHRELNPAPQMIMDIVILEKMGDLHYGYRMKRIKMV